jgi:hypothetical protein
VRAPEPRNGAASTDVTRTIGSGMLPLSSIVGNCCIGFPRASALRLASNGVIHGCSCPLFSPRPPPSVAVNFAWRSSRCVSQVLPQLFSGGEGKFVGRRALRGPQARSRLPLLSIRLWAIRPHPILVVDARVALYIHSSPLGIPCLCRRPPVEVPSRVTLSSIRHGMSVELLDQNLLLRLQGGDRGGNEVA